MRRTSDTVGEVEELARAFCDSVTAAGRVENDVTLIAKPSNARPADQPCYAEEFNKRLLEQGLTTPQV